MKTTPVRAGQLLFSTAQNQKLCLIMLPPGAALTFAPVSCLALQSLSHLMKAALHDAIKEQGSSQKWFKHEGGTLRVQWADPGQTRKATHNTARTGGVIPALNTLATNHS